MIFRYVKPETHKKHETGKSETHFETHIREKTGCFETHPAGTFKHTPGTLETARVRFKNTKSGKSRVTLNTERNTSRGPRGTEKGWCATHLGTHFLKPPGGMKHAGPTTKHNSGKNEGTLEHTWRVKKNTNPEIRKHTPETRKSVQKQVLP